MTMRNLETIAAMVAAFWIVGAADWLVFGGQLSTYGIQPRTRSGLMGILLAPWLHGGMAHLMANSVGMLLFGGLVILRSRTHFWTVVLVGGLASGLGTWLLGRSALHVGASGLIFACYGYLLCTGWFERRLGPILLSSFVLLVWGSTLWGIWPLQREVSWEGHLFGLLGGAIAAWLLARGQRHSR
ncbi:MAG: rhomboid family intramembrane serine protease [Syntrophobacteraceae bacterium]|jgi:membrane associated rhomboid family serine protease|nr:rhomboid family intramembrane serine protease [Syntrophobacteraceae bacterium]